MCDVFGCVIDCDFLWLFRVDFVLVLNFYDGFVFGLYVVNFFFVVFDYFICVFVWIYYVFCY